MPQSSLFSGRPLPSEEAAYPEPRLPAAHQSLPGLGEGTSQLPLARGPPRGKREMPDSRAR